MWVVGGRRDACVRECGCGGWEERCRCERVWMVGGRRDAGVRECGWWVGGEMQV